MEVKPRFPRFNCLVVELHVRYLGIGSLVLFLFIVLFRGSVELVFFLRRMLSWPPDFCLGVVDVVFWYVFFFLGGGGVR